MRLVTVTHFYPAHGGGLERVADHLIAEFDSRGMTVDWFSSDTDPAPVNHSSNVTCIPARADNSIEKLSQLPYPLWSPGSLARLWKAIGAADIVHTHEHLYLPSIMAIVFARLRRKPVVITQHMGALGLGNRLLTVLYETGAKVLGCILFAATTRAVFISANVQRFFNQHTSERSKLIYNGIDAAGFVPASEATRNALRAELGMPADRPVALFVGRLVRKKGLHIVESLAEQVPEVHWVLVGTGPQAPVAGRLSNLRLAGRVEHDILPKYYQAADFLVLPSAGEGFPLVVQEALCCGAGVLSTEEVGAACPEVASLIRTRPTPRRQDDPDGWVAELRSIIADKAYLADRDNRARIAHSLWSWDRCATQYLELFDSMRSTSSIP
jgi:glycosyltransferase involved in cell wall biosynthesis